MSSEETTDTKVPSGLEDIDDASKVEDVPVNNPEEEDEEYQNEDEGEAGAEDEEDADPEVEDEEEEEEEEEEEFSAEEEPEVQPQPIKRRRGRPPKHRPEYDYIDEFGNKRHHADSGTSTPRSKGRRGRRPAVAPEGTLRSESGRILQVVDDEYDISEDEEGEKKITRDGELLDGREYRVRTFKVKGRGNKLYMLSTEPARCMGFRDSYLLFQKHRTLFKIVIDQDEKFDLIERDIIPHSYKGRVIGLVTARSVYREFGAKIVVGGRNIVDDYNVKKLREAGVPEGELAEPDDKIPPAGTPYNKNQFVAWHGASNVYHQGTIHQQAAATPAFETLEMKSMKALKSNALMSEETWMLQHANAIREVDSVLLQNRYALARGIRDPYTGTTFVPALTQPTHVEYAKIVDENEGNFGKRKKLVFETVMSLPNLAKKTGLKDVPLEMFADCVDEETKNAILKQQDYERTLV